MAEIMLVELETQHVVWLAWAAGNAAGAGNQTAADYLNDILARIQTMEIPDLQKVDSTFPEQDYEGPAEVSTIYQDTQEERERTVDPLFVPPTPPPPVNDDSMFGAGPPPGPIG